MPFTNKSNYSDKFPYLEKLIKEVGHNEAGRLLGCSHFHSQIKNKQIRHAYELAAKQILSERGDIKPSGMLVIKCEGEHKPVFTSLAKSLGCEFMEI